MNYYFYRTESCGVFGGRVEVRNTSNGALIGTIDYNMVDYSYTSADLSNWAHQFQIQAYSITGAGAGATVSGSFSCSGACRLSSQSFPTQPVRLNAFENAES